MNITYFTNKFIEEKCLISNPQEDNGFDYEIDDDYRETGEIVTYVEKKI